MAKKAYDEVTIHRTLSKNRGVNFDGRDISIDNSTGTVGNNTWGKIDYLCKVHGYKIVKNENNNKHSHGKHYTPKIVNLNKKDNVAKVSNKGVANNMMVNLTKMAMKNNINHN